jgi:hypothetical protein
MGNLPVWQGHPIHGLIAGKNDPLGQDRILQRDKHKRWALYSTLATEFHRKRDDQAAGLQISDAIRPAGLSGSCLHVGRLD